MAKETKAERLAREAAEHQARVANETAQYLPKLMTALEEATWKNNYELEVFNGMFQLRDRDAEYDATLYLNPTYTETNWDELQSLEWDLQRKAEERAESERLTQVRRQAFLKLSKEEQDALGLTDRNNW